MANTNVDNTVPRLQGWYKSAKFNSVAKILGSLLLIVISIGIAYYLGYRDGKTNSYAYSIEAINNSLKNVFINSTSIAGLANVTAKPTSAIDPSEMVKPVVSYTGTVEDNNNDVLTIIDASNKDYKFIIDPQTLTDVAGKTVKNTSILINDEVTVVARIKNDQLHAIVIHVN